MKLRGSITVFFVLIFSVVISLVSGLLLSAKVSAGRVQIANGVDLSLFSAMAKYDRQLFEEYHLLYIDGGYGTGTLQLGKALDEIESDFAYSLTPNKEKEWLGGKNFLQLEEVSGSIIGYTLATDCNGSVFREQVISYMEDTLNLQGISLLTQNMDEISSYFQESERIHKKVEDQGTLEEYENIKREMDIQKEQTEKEEESNDGTKKEDVKELISPEVEREAARAKNTLDGISRIKKGSINELVIPDGIEISGWESDEVGLEDRTLNIGMGYLELMREESIWDDLLFQEYMIQNINSFTNQLHETGPAYGMEKILFDRNSDAENLDKMINRLIAIREAVNVAHIYSDQEKWSQITLMAASLAAVLGVPGVDVIIEGAIALGWAYVESVVDVHALLKGEKVPFVKDSTNWQVGFEEIISALERPDDFGKNVGNMSYEAYLRLLLTMKSKKEQVSGCMEVIEESMREIEGKEGFRMDTAIDGMEVEFVVRAEDFLDYTIREKRSYRSM